MSISSNFPTLRPTLLLDFANSGRLDARVTFTRASTATYFDETGTLQSAAIDAPRFDYDPATLAARGFLIEGARTNSIRNNTMQGAVAGTPGTVPTNWDVVVSGSGITREVVGTGTEDGITYVDLRFYGTGSGAATPQIRPETTTSIVSAVGQTWTASYYLRIVGGSTTGITSWVQIWQERDAAGVALTNANAIVSAPTTAALKTQRSVTTRTLTDAAAVRLTNRIQWAFVDGVAVDITLRIGLPQLEQGAFATSVIPTTTTALTRSADVASVNTLSPWFNATESTLFMEVTPVGVRSTSSPIVTIDDGTTANRIAMLASAANSMQNSTVVSGVLSGNTSAPATTYAAGSTYKIAFGVALDNVQSASGGASGVVDTTALIPSGLTALKFAAQGASTGLNNFWFKRVTYYPRRLSSAELAAITA